MWLFFTHNKYPKFQEIYKRAKYSDLNHSSSWNISTGSSLLIEMSGSQFASSSVVLSPDVIRKRLFLTRDETVLPAEVTLCSLNNDTRPRGPSARKITKKFSLANWGRMKVIPQRECHAYTSPRTFVLH